MLLPQFPEALGSDTGFNVEVLPFESPDSSSPNLEFKVGNNSPITTPRGSWTEVVSAGQSIKTVTISSAGDALRQTLLVRLTDATGARVFATAEQLPVPLRHNPDDEQNPWVLRFHIVPTRAVLRFEPEKIFVHGQRNGHETRALRVLAAGP
jgi:hypothetical protein